MVLNFVIRSSWVHCYYWPRMGFHWSLNWVECYSGRWCAKFASLFVHFAIFKLICYYKRHPDRSLVHAWYPRHPKRSTHLSHIKFLTNKLRISVCWLGSRRRCLTRYQLLSIIFVPLFNYCASPALGHWWWRRTEIIIMHANDVHTSTTMSFASIRIVCQDEQTLISSICVCFRCSDSGQVHLRRFVLHSCARLT